MAERVIKVNLVAQVSNYVASMREARKATKEVGEQSEEAKKKVAETHAAMSEVGQGLLAVGALAAVGVGLAIRKFADFDEAMSHVQAATQESASNMDLLREKALEAGARTVYSAEEAAGAIEELGKAGLSTSDILSGGLDAALDLAAAGGLDVANAAEIAAVALKTFGLRGSDMSHVADILAAGAGKAMGGVEDLGEAMKNVGQTASGMGLTIDETVVALTAFASAGIVGGEAGTGFKSMLMSLSNPSKEAREEMDSLGISAYDAQGNFVGLSKFAGNLKNSMSDLTVEQRQASQSIIFGSYGARAASILYKEGSEGIDRWTEAVDEQGFAAKVAAERLNSLKGDVEQLGGALDTALIRGGSGANDVLRTLTQAATGMVDVIGDLPEPVLAGGLALGGLIAAVGIIGGTVLVTVPKIAQFRLALETLKVSGAGVAKGIGGLTGVIAVAGTAFALYADYQGKISASTSQFKDTLDGTTGAVTKHTRVLLENKLAEVGAYDAAKEAGISQRELTEAVLEGGSAMDAVSKKFSANNTLWTFFSGVGVRAGNASHEVRILAEGVQKAGKEFEDQAAAAEGSESATDGAAKAFLEASDTSAQLSDNLFKLIDALMEANGTARDAEGANAALQKSLEDVKKSVAEYTAANGVSVGALDENTVAGSENRRMLADLAATSEKAAKAALAAGGSTDSYKASLEQGRKAIFDTALALTGNADAAQKLTDKIYAMPSEKQIKMIVNAAEADNSIQSFLGRWDNKQFTVKAIMDTTGMDKAAAVAASRWSGIAAQQAKALGKPFYNGGPTGDSVPRTAIAGVVHGQEFVSTARTAAIPENRAALEYMHRGGVIRGYEGGGFVEPVRTVSTASYVSQVSQPVTVSLAGAKLHATLEGAPITLIVQDQLVQADRSNSRSVRAGRR